MEGPFCRGISQQWKVVSNILGVILFALCEISVGELQTEIMRRQVIQEDKRDFGVTFRQRNMEFLVCTGFGCDEIVERLVSNLNVLPFFIICIINDPNECSAFRFQEVQKI